MSQATVEEMRRGDAGPAKDVGTQKKKGAKKAARKAKAREGLTIDRVFTKPGQDPLEAIVWERRTSAITNPDGSIVFKLEGAQIPANWSQLATDIVVSKYFRKSGLYGRKDLGETSVAQVVERLAVTIREAGEQQGGYFASKADAEAFEAELAHMLVHQIGAFNSPVWFNCGLWHRYKIAGSGGIFAWDAETDAIIETKNAYERPQCSACFIQSVDDDLMSIYELVKTEARLFKYGSGTGTNFSTLRGRQEKLSGGGTSSGLMSFLEVFDRAAGATKSGGTTRRAAKMVCLDVSHPEILDFIEWKLHEERKAIALIAQGYESDFNGEAYHTVSGQNSNNSIRITDGFMFAVQSKGPWQTIARTTGEVVATLDAADVWDRIANAAWACADPGVQFDTTINKWHTCPVSGRINASNPCSEYMFVDDSACNLSSLNLTKFMREDGSFDVELFRHAVRVFFLAQEILVDFSAYPTPKIALNSHRFRPLGLGYANLGTMLMLLGMPYDSDQGRAMAAAVTAVMHGEALATSAKIARSKGTFEEFDKNRDAMLQVMEMHREAAYAIDRANCLPELHTAAREGWDQTVSLGRAYGYRNAQATVLAPTGTIGLLMDCDTTGIEPDFALVKFKKLAGGGYFKIVNQSVPAALRRLGYAEAQVQDIVAYVSGTNTLVGAPHVHRASLKGKGLTDEELAKIEAALPRVFELSQAFSAGVLGREVLARLGVSQDAMSRPGFSLLDHLEFNRLQIAEANEVIVGRMTIEGAPHLRDDHYGVFDCANRCGHKGKRFLPALAHLRMMAAVQPFLSGAISKTVNVPNEATAEDIKKLYEEGWRLGLKAVAIYRDGSKASQPLSSSSKESDKKEAKEDAKQPPRVTVVETPRPTLVPTLPELGIRGPGVRVRLPKKRTGFTQEARVGGHKIFLRTGEYADGTLGEIFIDMHKEGAAFRSVMNCLSMAVSIGIQYGVPLETYVEQFTFTRFEPQGSVEGHPNIKMATSIVDYIFRVLGIEYLKRYDFAHVPPQQAQRIDDPAETRVPDSRSLGSEEQPALLMETQETLPGLMVPAERHLAEGIENPLSQHLVEMMGDAPVCNQCGHITIRNGACYKCLNCGNSIGCS